MPFDGLPLARPIRVAVVPEPPGGGTDPKVAATVRRAAQALADAGYVVEEACPPRYEDAVSCWARLIMGDFASVLGMLAPMMGVDATAFVNNFNETVPPLADVASFSHLMVERDGIARAWSIFMAERPLLLTPTWTQLPFEHGFDSATAAGTAATKELMRPVVPYGMHTSPTALLRRVPFSESMMLRRHSGAEMEGSLGRFGDRRLEKGGPACWLGWFVWANRASAYAAWVVIAPARCDLPGSCVTGG